MPNLSKCEMQDVDYDVSVSSRAARAQTSDLKNGPQRLKSVGACRGPNVAGNAIVVDMAGFATSVTDEEDAVVAAVRVGAGDIGVTAFNPSRDVAGNEQIKNTIHCVS